MSEYGEMVCPYCGDDGPTFAWTWKGQGYEIKATCTSCGKYLKWMSLTEENKAIAGEKPTGPPAPEPVKKDTQRRLF